MRIVGPKSYGYGTHSFVAATPLTRAAPFERCSASRGARAA